MRISTYLVVGTHPLLMHNPETMSRNGHGKGGLGTKQIPSAEDEAAASRYLTEDGYFWVPTQAFKSCLVSASKGRRINKMAATSVLKGTVFPAEDRTFLLDAKNGKPLKGDHYEVDVRRAVVQGSGIPRARAKVSGWSCKVVLELDELITDNLILECLNLGGRTVGICDFRPATGGPFGRFTATLL